MTDSANNPLVSIIVRTKDRPKLLKKALASIAAQTYRPIEAVLVNDGGCDLETEDLRSFLGDVSLSYIRLEKNTGRAHAGNVGIENAKGEYIGFLDDDDEFYPEHVETAVVCLNLNKEYKVAYSDSEIIKIGLDQQLKETIDIVRFPAAPEFSREHLLFENYIPFMSLLFQKDVLLGSGPLDEDLEVYEDWDLLIRISRKEPFYHIGKVTTRYYYWSNSDQITAKVGLAREPYMKVVRRYAEEIGPDALYENYLISADRKELITRLFSMLHESSVTKEQIILAHEEMMSEKQRIISEKEQFISEKERLISEKEQSISQIRERVHNLETHLLEVYNTFGWKLLVRFRKARDKIVPYGTRLRALYDIFVKSLQTITTNGWRVFVEKSLRRLKREFFYEAKRRNNLGSCFPRKLEALNEQRRVVDIVVPVYNAVDSLNECLDSVLRHTDLKFNNLTIIDDNSSDARVKDLLKQISQNDKKINVLYNHDNVGFVKTVNKGMQMSNTNDVIILNSDTIVTRGWVEKLQRAAYSRNDVATATPFSNNATICSIPRFLENNSVPSPFDIQSFGEFIEDIALMYYPEIPTGVGFCMYIKRHALQDIGFFDETRFGKGYGEENDFCMKALKRGYKHVLDDATFIYHKGGESFTLHEKLNSEQQAVSLLDTIHPEYLPMIYRFLKENPLKPIHNYINLRLELLRHKSRC